MKHLLPVLCFVAFACVVIMASLAADEYRDRHDRLVMERERAEKLEAIKETERRAERDARFACCKE